MKKGGYQILDFKATTVPVSPETVDDQVELPGAFETISNSDYKRVVVSGLVIAGTGTMINDAEVQFVEAMEGDVLVDYVGQVYAAITDDNQLATAWLHVQANDLVWIEPIVIGGGSSGGVTDVEVDGVSVVTEGVAEITLPTVPVQDVEVNGASVLNAQGVAEITIPSGHLVECDQDDPDCIMAVVKNSGSKITLTGKSVSVYLSYATDVDINGVTASKIETVSGYTGAHGDLDAGSTMFLVDRLGTTTTYFYTVAKATSTGFQDVYALRLRVTSSKEAYVQIVPLVVENYYDGSAYRRAWISGIYSAGSDERIDNKSGITIKFYKIV